MTTCRTTGRWQPSPRLFTGSFSRVTDLGFPLSVQWAVFSFVYLTRLSLIVDVSSLPAGAFLFLFLFFHSYR